MRAFVARCQVNILAWVAQRKDGVFFGIPAEMRFFRLATSESNMRFALPATGRGEGGGL